MTNDQIFVLGMTTIVCSACVLFAIVGAVVARRRGAAKGQPRLDPAVNDRLAHMEQAIDAIAVEVERISEGQRFVTKLLSERTAAAGQIPERVANQH